MEASTREATVTHVLNLLISKLTSADIQSTITPDEGRNVHRHKYNVEACDTAKQAFLGMDGLMEMIQLKNDGVLRDNPREIKERAILMMEGILAAGGYFNAVEMGYFVDSGFYLQQNGDGIARKIDGGITAGSVFERDSDYFAPVSSHYGYNNLARHDAAATADPARLIDGSTLENPDLIQYIDELDETDNVNVRMVETQQFRNTTLVKPEAEWLGDGTVLLTLFIAAEKRVAEAAAIEFAQKMNLKSSTVR